MAVAQIATDEPNLKLLGVLGLQDKSTAIVRSLGTELTNSHVSLIPAVLSAFS